MTFKKTSASWHRQVGAGLSFGQRLTIRLTVLISSKLKTLNDRLIKNLRILQEALAQESTETKRMLETYQKYLASQATEDEMAKANHQLRDLMKGLGLGVIVVLPFAPITLPLVLGLGRKFGVELLPSSFSKERKIKSKDVETSKIRGQWTTWHRRRPPTELAQSLQRGTSTEP